MELLYKHSTNIYHSNITLVQIYDILKIEQKYEGHKSMKV